MKVAFFDIDSWSSPYIKRAFPGAILIEDRLSLENVYNHKDTQILSTFHTSDLSRVVLEKLPHLKLAAIRATGYNNVDMQYCAKSNVIVCNVPTYGRRTVAEHAFGLILTLTRKLYTAIDRVKKDGKFNIIGLQGTDLFGKTIGIVGLGEIGTSMLKIAKGFGMDVLIYTRTQDPTLAQEMDFEYAQDLDDLLGRSDIITLHLPLNEHTQHTINVKNIQNIKKGAYLINTARGGLIETEAILQALEEEILAGVGLDVLENEVEFQEEADLLSSHVRAKIDYENLVLDHVLIKHEKVVVTPHNAFNSNEARLKILTTSFENIHNFLDGKPQNVVTA